jgi:aspartate racemase
MRVIGMVGGTSWEATQVYYRLINEDVKERLGGYHSARMVIVNVDLAPLEEMWSRGGENSDDPYRRPDGGCD